MRLEIIDESGQKRIEQSDKNKIEIGRSSKSDIQIIGEGISRHHLTLELVAGKYYVTDHGSLNGVYVNEERLPAEKKVEVLQFFPIRIGVRTTISILSDDITRDIRPQSVFEMKVKTSSDIKLELNHATRTKTKAVPKKGAEHKGNKSGQSNKAFNRQMLLIFGALALIIYFFTQTEPRVAEKTVIEPTTTQIAKPTESPSPGGSVVHQSNPYYSLNIYKQREIKKHLDLYKKPGCQLELEKRGCELMEAQFPLEKVVIENNEAYIFTDYRIHRSSKYLLKFDTKTEAEILELWLARLALKMRFELGQEFTKVIVVHINAQPQDTPPLVTHTSFMYQESMLKVPDMIKQIDSYIDQSITINLDEKIRPYITFINYFN